ncbi:MAG: rhodanese-like domain-containing protein [Woeseiaceae bacterium]|nr:rhodanese-like domain-containing protein [Woeseiaceae bacterium]
MLVSPADFVAKAKATIKECTVSQVEEFLNSDTILVDIREPEEYARGHIPGAIHVPRGMLEFQILKTLEHIGATTDPADADMVLYCGTGGRSALAAKSMDDMGFRNVRSMDGGIVAWNEAGLPVDKPA